MAEKLKNITGENLKAAESEMRQATDKVNQITNNLKMAKREKRATTAGVENLKTALREKRVAKVRMEENRTNSVRAWNERNTESTTLSTAFAMRTLIDAVDNELEGKNKEHVAAALRALIEASHKKTEATEQVKVVEKDLEEAKRERPDAAARKKQTASSIFDVQVVCLLAFPSCIENFTL
eukprot:TRINITY_DN733_c0_g2_i4.p2 TRINITY_DN733_c0_g2~~TRINITY_DN733_c0_g2_i4.p2  ORF type:complete len:181 (+),score=33.86 TRINITY_DN733_c0_g2_i4:1271-1813(+)